MICNNCGFEIPEGSAFCGNCGAQIAQEETVTPQEATTEQYAVDNEVYTQGYTEDYTENMYIDQQEEIKPKKKFKIPKKLIFITIPAIVLVVAIIFNWYAICGYFVKWFGSDADYFTYVEKANAENSADAISEMYGKMLSMMDSGTGSTEADMKITIGDKAFDMLSLAGVSESYVKKFDFLKEIDLNVNFAFEELKMQYQVGLGIGGEEILKGDIVVDGTSGAMYAGLPGLSDKYIKSGNATVQYDDEIMEAFESIVESLPDDSDVNDLLEKYLEIAFECISDKYVDVSDGTLVANNIEQDCTVVEVEVTDKLLLKMCLEIAKEATDDEEIEEIIDKLEDVVNDLATVSGANEIDLYDELSDELLQTIEELEEMIDNIEEERALFYLTDYVDGTHNIIGRKIEISDYSYEYDEMTGEEKKVFDKKEIFFMGKTENGDCGYECWLNVEGVKIQLLGKGSESWWNEVITGEFELVISAKDKSYTLLEIETEELDCAEITEKLSGLIRVRPGENLVDFIAETMGKSTAHDVKKVISFLDPSIEIKMNNSSDTAENTIEVMSGDDLFFGIEMKTKTDENAEVIVPGESEVVDQERWVESLDFDSVIEKLKKIGVPSEILNAFMNGLESSF